MWWRTTIAAAVALGGCMAAAGIASADPPPPAPPPPPEPKTSIEHDGTYAVGTDLVAGTYSSAGPVEGATCYWKRVGGPDGNTIVANAMTKKPQVVQIDAGDKMFKTDSCQPWQKTDGAQAPEGVPPLLAGPQLRALLEILNAGAGASGAGQLPPPPP
jgi:hypothetical protein